jgi:tRNA A-37 threonylcarbamoyl transferase component Bud32
MKFDNIIAVRAAKTIYRDGDKAIKLFNEDFSKSDVLNEALNQARVEETALHVPQVVEVTKIDGKWAIVSEYIEGKTLMQIMKDETEKFDEYLDFFVDLQMTVHAQRAPLLGKLKDKMSRKMGEADIEAATRYDLNTRLEGLPKHNKVCHGDFNPSNIIIKPDGTPYILDWSHATQGNASADVARTYLLFCLNGESETAEKYLELFCQKSGTEMKYVQKWMPIVAASQSVKGNQKEREFLLSWARVVDFE